MKDKNNDKYILNVQTVQANNIKTLFEVLKDVLLTDINIIFTPDYIKVMEIDSSNTAIVHLLLKSTAFEYYYCEKEVIYAGLNTNNLFKIIKIANQHDIISLCIERGNDYILYVKIENNNDKRVFESKLNLFDVPILNIVIPEVEFESTISIPSVKFQKYMKDLNSLGVNCNLDIQSVGQQLSFSCKGDFASNKIVIGESSKNTFIQEDSMNIIQGKYSLKFIILFTKATSLCNTVDIYLKNDYPLILEYSVGVLGSLRFILSPIERN